MPAPLTPGSDAHLEAALAASARAEASLTSLFRAIQQLGTGVGGAREANESLTAELEALRDLLGTASDQQQRFERKVSELEAVLDRLRNEHQRERTFLIDQQDTFLVKLLDEQEAELKRRDHDLATLRGRLAEVERREGVTAPPPPLSLPSLPPQAPRFAEPARASESPGAAEHERAERAELEKTAQRLAEDRERARETVARLQTQRDDAQNAVARITLERDEALHVIHRLKSELGGPRIPLSTRPPPADSRRDSSSARASQLALDQIEMESRLNRPISAAPASSPRASSAPLGLPSSSSSGAAPKTPVISSVLSPPRSNPNAAPLPTRLSPPPTRISPPPGRHSPPPEELRRALTGPPSIPSMPLMPSLASSRPPLKQKPDPSTRPLVDYSLGNDSVEAEHVEGVRLSSKPAPPGSGKR